MMQKGAPKTIFSFSDPIEFLQYTIESTKSQKNKAAWTQKAWAKRLGYQSDRSLGMILKRQRSLTPKMVSAIGKSLKLDAKEFRYFDLLVRKDLLLKSVQDTSLVDRELRDILAKAPRHKEFELTLDDRAYAMVSNWYHFPIKQLIASPGFTASVEWISKKLRDKVSAHQVKEAINNLLKIGVIREDASRGYTVVEDSNIRKLDNIPSIAVKQHHAQMLQRAGESIGQQSIDEREIQSLTLRVDPNQMKDVKEAILTFVKEFNRRFGDDNSNQVFQLNVQFFEHTTRGE